MDGQPRRGADVVVLFSDAECAIELFVLSLVDVARDAVLGKVPTSWAAFATTATLPPRWGLLPVQRGSRGDLTPTHAIVESPPS